nr:hypothetical protein [Paenibacillus sp. BJ-4]
MAAAKRDFITFNYYSSDTVKSCLQDKHIEQCQLAITDEVELFGYCPWSAIDLSAPSGSKQTFGSVL